MAEKHRAKNDPWQSLAQRFVDAVRKPTERRIGIEVERFGLWPDGSPLLYSGSVNMKGEQLTGMRHLLEVVHNQRGWTLKHSDFGDPLEISTPQGNISLEPGSQLEMSVNPARNLFELFENLKCLEVIFDHAAQDVGLRWVSLGLQPFSDVDTIEVIPYARYRIMTRYLSKVGSLATSMMRLTTSIQINLDYTSEEEAVEMLRVALAISPVSYALFANSPFSKGKKTEFLSYRSWVWRNTDPNRCGLLPIAFDQDFRFGKYAELLWHLPLMYALDKRGEFQKASGRSLATISKNTNSTLYADSQNQSHAIQQLFTEARMKPGFVEIRSVDGLPKKQRMAAVAFWVGLLYSAEARKLAMSFAKSLDHNARMMALDGASRMSLKAKYGKWTFRNVASTLLDAAEDGLKQRGQGEDVLLIPLRENIEEGFCPAERLIQSLAEKPLSPRRLFDFEDGGESAHAFSQRSGPGVVAP